MLALFAGQPYDSELQDLTNLDSHLTNTCRLEGALAEEEAVRLLSELPEVIRQPSAQLHMLFCVLLLLFLLFFFIFLVLKTFSSFFC